MAQRGKLGAGEVVLIVDDDVAYCAAIREILDHDGYHPVIANSVEDALELLKDTTPDIILSDTMMPLTDGGSLLRILRRMDRFADLPIVTVSAKAMPTDKAEAFAAGASGFLAKPFPASQLLEEIERHLDERDQQAA